MEGGLALSPSVPACVVHGLRAEHVQALAEILCLLVRSCVLGWLRALGLPLGDDLAEVAVPAVVGLSPRRPLRRGLPSRAPGLREARCLQKLVSQEGLRLNI